MVERVLAEIVCVVVGMEDGGCIAEVLCVMGGEVLVCDNGFKFYINGI